MPTPTASNRLLLSILFLATGTVLMGAGLFGSSKTASGPEDVPETAAVVAKPQAMAAPESAWSQMLSEPQTAEAKPVKVLVLGDSHTSSTFGRALDLLLRSRPETEVTTVGACGHRPGGFLSGKESRCGLLQLQGDNTQWAKAGTPPELDALLEDMGPHLTVVELGANQIHTAWRDPVGARREITALATKLAAQGECVWVGPPTGREREKPRKKINHVYKILRQALPAGCTLLDSRPETLDFLVWNDLAKKAKRRGDGKHFDTLGPIGQQAARKWALHVFKSVGPALNALAGKNTQVARYGPELADSKRLVLASR